MERLFELTRALTALPSVSGYENTAFPALEKLAAGLFDETRTTPTGSFIGILRCKKPFPKTLILDAHLDEIGFIVSGVHDDGFLSVAAAGGVDTRVLSAAEVTVYGKKTLRGVFTSTPPHLQSSGDAEKKLELKDLYIDTGLDGETLKDLVQIGDFAKLHAPAKRLLNGFVTSHSLDDKICVAQILRAVEMVDREKLNFDLYAVFSGGEEIGGVGAKTAAFSIDADFAVVLDVCNSRGPDCPNFLEDIRLGDGPVLSFSSTTHRALTASLLQTAKDAGIPCQLRGEPGRTGTNAQHIQIARGGIPCTNLSVPLRYMHSGAEAVHLKDVENGARLLALFAEKAAESPASPAVCAAAQTQKEGNDKNDG